MPFRAQIFCRFPAIFSQVWCSRVVLCRGPAAWHHAKAWSRPSNSPCVAPTTRHVATAAMHSACGRPCQAQFCRVFPAIRSQVWCSRMVLCHGPAAWHHAKAWPRPRHNPSVDPATRRVTTAAMQSACDRPFRAQFCSEFQAIRSQVWCSRTVFARPAPVHWQQAVLTTVPTVSSCSWSAKTACQASVMPT